MSNTDSRTPGQQPTAGVHATDGAPARRHSIDRLDLCPGNGPWVPARRTAPADELDDHREHGNLPDRTDRHWRTRGNVGGKCSG